MKKNIMIFGVCAMLGLCFADETVSMENIFREENIVKLSKAAGSSSFEGGVLTVKGVTKNTIILSSVKLPVAQLGNLTVTAKGSGKGKISCCINYFDANGNEIELKNVRPITLKGDDQECQFETVVPFTCKQQKVPASAQIGFNFWKDFEGTLSNVTINFEPVSGNPALKAVKRTDWAADLSIALTKKAKQSHCRIMFLGDSLTHMWIYAADHNQYPSGLTSWNNVFKPMGADNYGIAGDRIEHVLWRITEGEQLACQPELVILLIGTNNRIAQKLPSEMICEGIANLVTTIKNKSPNSKILLIAIPPRKGVPRDAAGGLLKAMAETQKCGFLDPSDALLEAGGGEVAEAIFRDGLHLSPKGYEVYAEVLLPKVKEMLGEQ